MAGGMSGAAEQCLLCLSSSLAEALPNRQRFGEEEARRSRKVHGYSGEMGEGELELPSGGRPCRCPGRQLSGHGVGIVGWLSLCTAERRSPAQQ